MTAFLGLTYAQRAHLEYVIRIFLMTVVLWAVGGIVATFFGPAWPQGTGRWVDFALLVYIVEFLLIKSYRMADNTRIWKRLGISLIAVNIAFASIYLASLLFALWPSLIENEWIRRGLRVEVAAFVSWTCFEVLRFPGGRGQTRPRLTAAIAASAVLAIAVFLWRLGVFSNQLDTLQEQWYTVANAAEEELRRIA